MMKEEKREWQRWEGHISKKGIVARYPPDEPPTHLLVPHHDEDVGNLMAHVGNAVGSLPADALEAGGDQSHARGRPHGDTMLESGWVCKGLLDNLR